MITFNTAKSLYKYLPIETKEVVDGLSLVPDSDNDVCIYNKVSYPAPNLEELLKASPIELHINTDWLSKTILINADYHFQDHETMIKFEDSLVEAVAKIIIEYYKQQEQNNECI